MQSIKTLPALRRYVADARASGKRVAFVPTMGALHDGHLELLRQGLVRCDLCIPYIFVNPKQFAPTEDLAAYPRTRDADLEKLQAAGAQAVYLPAADDIYPDGFATSIAVSGVALPLEGECRPVMFGGVATVVTKMLLRCLPDIALFGEKDWQQLQVIRTVARDLDIPVEIVGVPTVRDANGLALSSRNAYLSPEQYLIAIQLNKILASMSAAIAAGENIQTAESAARGALLAAGFESVDYITARDAQTLLPPKAGAKFLRLLAAVKLGKARLIDNMPLAL